MNLEAERVIYKCLGWIAALAVAVAVAIAAVALVYARSGAPT